MLGYGHRVLKVRSRVRSKLGGVISGNACVVDKQLDTVWLFARNFVDKFLDLVLFTDIDDDARPSPKSGDISLTPFPTRKYPHKVEVIRNNLARASIVKIGH